MVYPPAMPADAKARVVLGVLAGTATITQAARGIGVSPQSVRIWRRAFIEGGTAALVGGTRGPASADHAELHAEIAALKERLRCLQGELTVARQVA